MMLRDVVKAGASTFTIVTKREPYTGYAGEQFDYLSRVTERRDGRWIEEARYPSKSEPAAADKHKHLVRQYQDS